MFKLQRFSLVFVSVCLLVHLPFGCFGLLLSQGSNYDTYTYVTDYWQHSVVVIRNLQIVERLVTSGDGATNSLDITPDHTRIYAASGRVDSVSVLVVDPDSTNYRKEIAVIKTAGSPLGVRVHPDGLKVYVAARRNIHVIDSDPESPSYNTITKTVEMPRNVFDLDFAAGGDSLFVLHEDSPPNNLSVIETLTDTLEDTDDDASNGVTSLSMGQFVGGSAWFRALRISPYGYGFILNTGDTTKGYGAGTTISVFDSATMLPVDVDNDPSTTTPGEPEGVSSIVVPGTLPVSLDFSSDGGRLLVGLRNTTREEDLSTIGKIIMIDTDPSSQEPYKILKVSNAGKRPEGVAVWPDGKYIFVSCKNEHLIRVFDANLKPVTTIPVSYAGQMLSIRRSKVHPQKALAKSIEPTK